MKHFKTLPILLFLLVISNGNAQMVHEANVLFYRYTMTEFPYVYSDKVTVTKVFGDTTWFASSVNNPSGKGYYYRVGQKVYRVPSNSIPVLYYDYSLAKGDTFFSRIGAVPDTFIVDSVYHRTLNGHTFKAWHLTMTRLNYGSIPKLDWVEGLGDLRTGWDYKCYMFVDDGWEVKGICLHDSVLYWNTDMQYFKDREPSPSCMFDSIGKRLGLEKPVSNSINIYPNPASDVLNLNTKSNGTFSILDQNGKICIKDQPFEAGNHAINISVLEPGIYCIAILSGSELLYRKICVVRNL